MRAPQVIWSTSCNGTDDIPGDEEKSAFVAAFNEWARVVPFTFTEVFTSEEAYIKIQYVGIADFSSTDASVNAYAVSYGPEYLCKGLILINDNFRFCLTPTSGKVLLQAVALHEIGHILGLCESGSSETVMSGVLTSLPTSVLSPI